MNFNFTYPKIKGPVPQNITAVSADYKKQVLQVFLSMMLFILVYLAILVGTLVLAYYSLIGGVMVIVAKPSFITLILGAGIICMGGLLVYFMLKFLFSAKADDRSHLIEVTADQEPVLFAFIAEVCNETQTDFPKKIFISADVNASVFYNSSFWSLFLPIRKNLELGAGLISGLNMSEFKAVVAHEFGHFSQSSTRLGSYVYRINRIIYHTVYENDGFQTAVNALSNIHGLLTIILSITVFIARGIIWVLNKLYAVVNIQYSALSRQMEFHADAVSVSVAGSYAIGKSLRRLEFAGHVFNQTLNQVNTILDETGKVPDNFFSIYTSGMPFFAKLAEMEVKDGLVNIDSAKPNDNHVPNRVSIKDLWASHPEVHERDARAQAYGIDADVVETSPWVLFSNPEELQKQLSQNMYSRVDADKAMKQISVNQYMDFVEENRQQLLYKPEYCGYYNNAFLPLFKVEDINLNTTVDKQFTDIFNTDLYKATLQFDRINEDLALLNAIAGGQVSAKQFELDGQLHKQAEAKQFAEAFKQDLDKAMEVLKERQVEIFGFFYHKLQQQGNNNHVVYKDALLFDERLRADLEAINQLRDKTIDVYNDIIAGRYNDDNQKHLTALLSQHYINFNEFKSGFVLPTVPQVLTEKGIITDYRAQVFSVELSHPAANKDLSALVPYINNLGIIADNIMGLRNKVFRVGISLQDEWIDAKL